MALSGKQRRYLRGLAHHLTPVVLIGRPGITDAVVRQVDTALNDHELIKVKVGTECPADRGRTAGTLAEKTASEVAGVIGRILILYRPRNDDPHIRLPVDQRAAGGAAALSAANTDDTSE